MSDSDWGRGVTLPNAVVVALLGALLAMGGFLLSTGLQMLDRQARSETKLEGIESRLNRLDAKVDNIRKAQP